MYFYAPYVPLQISDLKSGRSGYLSNDGHHVIWNDNTVLCLDYSYQDSKSVIDEFDKELALEAVKAINGLSLSKNNKPINAPAICKKCNFLNEFQPEDPNYICYKCKNF